MDSEIKKATNIGRIRSAESENHPPREVDELFRKPWDELVIRFDKRSHQYRVKTVVQKSRKNKTAGGLD